MARRNFFLRACKKVEENKKTYKEKADETRAHSARLIEMQKYVDTSPEKRLLLLDLILNEKCPDDPNEDLLHRGVLLFISLMEVMDVVEQDLINAKIKYYRIDGSTKAKERGRISKEVRENPENTVVMISLAGAESLNLNFTNQLIIYSIGGVSSYSRFVQLTGRISRLSGKFSVENGYQYYVHYVMVEDTADPYFKLLLSTRKEVEEEVLKADYIPLKDNLGSFNQKVLKKIRAEMLWKVKHTN